MSKNNYLTHFDEMKAGVENAARTFLQVIPGVGSALNQAVFGLRDIIEMKRIKNFMVAISDMIDNEEIQNSTLNKVNEYMTSGDGHEYFYLAIEKVKKTRNTKKIEYLRNLFVNQSSSEMTLDIDNAEKYLNTLDALDIESIVVLSFLENFKNANVQD